MALFYTMFVYSMLVVKDWRRDFGKIMSVLKHETSREGSHLRGSLYLHLVVVTIKATIENYARRLSCLGRKGAHPIALFDEHNFFF
ncbi:MAG: hypothetical protein WBJ72_07855, partial [Bacillota bacterium]